MRWQFKNKTPLSVMVLFAAILGNFLYGSLGSIAVAKWWPVSPDATHARAMHLKGGGTIYVQPWLGISLDYSFWAGFALLAVFFAMLWVHRNQIEHS